MSDPGYLSNKPFSGINPRRRALFHAELHDQTADAVEAGTLYSTPGGLEWRQKTAARLRAVARKLREE